MSEQYRYVSFNPTKSNPPLDWSHEREWRWPSNHYGSDYEEVKDCLELWNLPHSLKVYQRGVHIIVRNKEDINWLQDKINIITSKESANTTISEYELARNLWWYSRLKSHVRMISIEQVVEEAHAGREGLGRFEGWISLWNENKQA